MARDAVEPARMHVLLLFIAVFMRLVSIRRRNRFQRKLRLLAVRSRRRRTEAGYFFHSQKQVYRRREVAWVLERPQFWFEQMVLNQYTNNIYIWREHFRISRETLQFLWHLVGPHLVIQDTNMHRAIPVGKRIAIALWRLATGDSYRTTGLVFGVGRCTALKLKDEFCAALLMNAKEFIKSVPKRRS